MQSSDFRCTENRSIDWTEDVSLLLESIKWYRAIVSIGPAMSKEEKGRQVKLLLQSNGVFNQEFIPLGNHVKGMRAACTLLPASESCRRVRPQVNRCTQNAAKQSEDGKQETGFRACTAWPSATDVRHEEPPEKDVEHKNK